MWPSGLSGIEAGTETRLRMVADHQRDRAYRSGCVGETGVGGIERAVEAFGESGIARVVRRDIVTELERSAEETASRVPGQRDGDQVIDSHEETIGQQSPTHSLHYSEPIQRYSRGLELDRTSGDHHRSC